jgi:type VI secretion system secreted protein VgrG
MPEDKPMQMVLTTSPSSTLKFRSMSGREEVSRLFEYRIIAITDDPAVDADALLGKPACVAVDVGLDDPRCFHGIVAGFGIDGVDGSNFTYRIVCRPWLWLATRAAGFRIFADMTAPEIIKDVLSAYSAGTVTDELNGTYGTRHYCVQYGETDFNFVSRLLEEEGIFYFFRHSSDKHEMVLADRSGSHQPAPGFASIPFHDDESHTVSDPVISRWQMQHEIQTGKVTLADWNFETPSTDLTSTPAAGSRSHDSASLEVFEYPGLYAVKADGDSRAELRLAEAQSRFARFTGRGNSPGLVTGGKITLAEHQRTDQNTDYVVLATDIGMQQGGYEAGASGETFFHCQFVAQKYADAFRPERITPKPTVAGLQTAVVIDGGGDGTTDEYGRVKLKFPWDRDGGGSCFVRVATGSAGNGWGMISLPRVGDEVVVSFIDGDPDRPLVVGSVYNAEQKTPYELPANATVSTWKSRSIDGGAADHNELRFEDKAGSEYVLINAQKDRIDFVQEMMKTEIGKDETRDVVGKFTMKVGDVYDLKVTGAVSHKFDDSLSIAAKDIRFKSETKVGFDISQDLAVKTGGKIALKSGADMHVKIGANIGAEAAQNVHIKGGMNVVIEGGMQVTIKAGGSSVVLGPDGVSITGTMVKINSGGGPGSGSGANPDAPDSPTAPAGPEAAEDPLSHR